MQESIFISLQYIVIEKTLAILFMILFPFILGKRKPDAGFYWDAVEHLKVDPSNCIFIDDRSYFFP